MSYSPDANIVVKNVINMNKAILEAALKVPELKRFVYTSSTSALLNDMTSPLEINDKLWNEEAVRLAWRPKEEWDHQFQGFYVYSASKVQGEQWIWNFVKERKPHFIVNTVVPNYHVRLSTPQHCKSY